MSAARILQHPVSGDRLVELVTTEESAGALFRFEYATHAVPRAPGDHVHAVQEERVEVLAGTLRCRIGGEERELRAGAAIVIPPGVPHAVWNTDPAGSRSVGEFRPALDTQTVLEAFFAAAAA